MTAAQLNAGAESTNGAVFDASEAVKIEWETLALSDYLALRANHGWKFPAVATCRVSAVSLGTPMDFPKQ
jgi:hypothetical protein